MPTVVSARRNNKTASSENKHKPGQLYAVAGAAGTTDSAAGKSSALAPFALPALLFISGAASLAYQLLWIKQLSLVVGIEVYAITIAVSAFFGGLAIGSYVFGRWADSSRQPLFVYAALEIGIALLAVAATYALGAAPAPFALLENRIGPAAWLLPMLLVGLPAVLMGGTLPVMMKALAPVGRRIGGIGGIGGIGRVGGGLYAANTAGAIIGSLMTPLLLIPALGVHGAGWATATLNIGGGILAILLARMALPCEKAPTRLPSKAQARNKTSARAVLPGACRATAALSLYALAGGVALGYEVVWSQLIVQFMSTRNLAFAIVLATYLLGLFLGSALFSRWADRIRDPWSAFGMLLAAAGAVALLEVTVLGAWLMQLQSYAAAIIQASTGKLQAVMGARFVVAAVSIVLAPTLMLGAAFPLALRLIVDAGHIGRDVGKVLALNTVGGILGTLLCGFVLVPWLGLVHSLAVLAVAASAIGAYAVFRGGPTAIMARRATVALAVIVLATAFLTPRDRLASLLSTARGGTLVHYEESRGATVAVVAQHSGQNRFNRLYIQGVSNSGDSMTSLRYMRLQALLPLIIQQHQPKSALVIGLGTGITSGALLQYPGLEHRVVAELLPAVVRAAPAFHGNYGVTSDPRMEIRVHDGRRELLSSPQRYDLITLEPPPPSAAGVVNLYSTEFYALAAKRLHSGGIVAQWLPLPTQNDTDTRSLVRSFLDVFPYATLWTTELHEMMLVGSFEPITLDATRIVERYAQPQVAQALREVGIASPAALLATWVTDRAGLERYVDGAPAVTDDRPRIEYAAWVHRDEIIKTLPTLLALYSEPPLQGADAKFKADIERERQRLMLFYAAGLNAYAGQREQWAENIRRLMRVDGDNPYYRWFTGGRTSE